MDGWFRLFSVWNGAFSGDMSIMRRGSKSKRMDWKKYVELFYFSSTRTVIITTCMTYMFTRKKPMPLLGRVWTQESIENHTCCWQPKTSFVGMEAFVTFFEGGVYDESMFGAFFKFLKQTKITLPETNDAYPKRKRSSSKETIFRCYVTVVSETKMAIPCSKGSIDLQYRSICQAVIFTQRVDMGVSKNRGTPKWMIYMEIPIKMDDLGVQPFSETPIWVDHFSLLQIFWFSGLL